MNCELGANTVSITNFVMQLKDNTISGAISCGDEPRSTAYPIVRPRHQDSATVFRSPGLNDAIEFPVPQQNLWVEMMLSRIAGM